MQKIKESEITLEFENLDLDVLRSHIFQCSGFCSKFRCSFSFDDFLIEIFLIENAYIVEITKVGFFGPSSVKEFPTLNQAIDYIRKWYDDQNFDEYIPSSV